MSSAGWIFVGLLFIIPLYDASEARDKTSGNKERPRRSIMNLKSMVQSITGREGSDFISYGNWCGLGGSGDPVDPIDECCQNHDLCYNLVTSGVCRKYGEKGVYQLEYKWRKADDETATCVDDEDKCKMTICMCDAILSNCLKSNIDFFNPKNQHQMDIFEMLKDADWITSP